MRLWLLCYAVADRMWSSSAAGAPAFCSLADGGDRSSKLQVSGQAISLMNTEDVGDFSLVGT